MLTYIGYTILAALFAVFLFVYVIVGQHVYDECRDHGFSEAYCWRMVIR